VVATCRDPESSFQLQELQIQHKDRLQILQLDTTDEDSIAAAAAATASLHSHIDLLLNVSGVLHIPGSNVSPETALSRLSLENLTTIFSTNAFGPMLVCKGFERLLVNAAMVNGATE